MKIFLATAAVLLAVLSGLPAAQAQTGVRFVHTVYNAPPVSVHFGALPLFLNKMPLSASAVRSELPPLTYQVQVRDTHSTNPALLYSVDMTVTDGLHQSLVFAGQPGNYTSLLLSWDKVLPQLGNVRLRFVHAAASVQQPVNVLIGGSLFFQPLSAISASAFIEVPLAQLSSLSYTRTDNDAELAKFTAAGAFEAGNVYTVYFVDGAEGPEARVVNETSIDEQAPMASLSRIGTLLHLRVVNAGTNLTALSWSLNGLEFAASVPVFSASQQTTAFIDGEVTAAVHPPTDPEQTWGQTTFTPAADRRYTLVSYGTTPALQVLALERTPAPAPDGQAYLRLVHTAPGLAAVEVLHNTETVLPATTYGTSSAFATIQAGTGVFRLRNSTTGGTITDFSLPAASGGTYTLLLKAVGSQMEVRLLNEDAPEQQNPLPILNIQAGGTARLRTVSLLPDITILTGNDRTPQENEQLGYADATPLHTDMATGTYTFNAVNAETPFISMVSISSQLEDNTDYLLVYFGEQGKEQAAIATSRNVKAPKDSVMVRFMHLITDQPEIRIAGGATGQPVADKLQYGDISGYRAVARTERLYDLLGGDQKPIAQLTDTYEGNDVMTIFLLRENDDLVGYLLPDASQEGFRPMLRLEATVGVEEHPSSAVVAPSYPNPAEHSTTLRLALATAADVAVALVDATGRTVHRLPGSQYAAGNHLLHVDCSTVAPGAYLLTVTINGKQFTQPLTIHR